MYHDVESQIIYLHLVSLEDHVVLSNMSRGLHPNMSQTDFHLWLEKQEYHHLKALLFLFMSCHILLIVHPDHNFDIGYLRILRILGIMKNLVGESVMNYLANTLRLQDFKFSSPFCPGRCVPIISFVFNDHLLSHLKVTTEKSTTNKVKQPKYNPMANTRAKLQTSLETQVRQLLKYFSQPDKNAPANNLYTLDQGHAVHVVTHSLVTSSISALFPQFGDEGNQYYSTDLFDGPVSSDGTKTKSMNDGVQSLKQWIISKSKAFYNQALTAKRGEIPTSRSWFLSALVLQDLFLYGRKVLGRNRGDLMEKIKAFLDADYKFSTSRCRDVMPAAREEYFRDLPEFYTTEFHEKRLARVYSVFASVAVGPAQSHYWGRLVDECHAYWTDGHEMCDEISTTGRPCVYKKHLTPQHDNEQNLNRSGNYQPRTHSSDYRTFHACNCGKTRSIREDPFTFEDANQLFYEGSECCQYLTVNQRPQTRFTIGNGYFISCPMPSWSLCSLGTSKDYSPERGLSFEGFLAGYNTLLPYDIALGRNQLNIVLEQQVEKDNPKNRRRAGPKKEKGRSTNLGGFVAEVLKEKNEEKRIYIGFEYECHNGHRFLLSADLIKQLYPPLVKMGRVDVGRLLYGHTTGNLANTGPGNQINGFKIPLFLKSPTSNAIGQLQRLYFVIPTEGSNVSSQVFVANPVVEFSRKSVDTKKPKSPSDTYPLASSQESQVAPSTPPPTPSLPCLFVLPNEVILPWDSIVCLRLPYIFPDPETLKPLLRNETRPSFDISLLDNVIYPIKNPLASPAPPETSKK
uniref:Nonsense-mediated mRNA decay factor SMG8 n=1 Tax=Arcella intermedia TaxID=1963864 RepID=A0A6B2KY46_9EUKA